MGSTTTGTTGKVSDVLGRNEGSSMKRLTTGIILFGLVSLWPSLGLAQDIVLEDIVTAEIEKPQAFYVLRASDLDYESMEPRDSFLPELQETVEHDPF